MKTIIVKDIVIGDGTPKICVPVVGKTKSEVLKHVNLLKNEDHDLMELRVDFFENNDDIKKILELLKSIREIYLKPLIFTFRTRDEGGYQEIDKSMYFELNHKVIESGLVDLIDIEFFNSKERIKEVVNTAKKHKAKIIMSSHDFNKTPNKEEIILRLTKMQELNADITKIAVMPTSDWDVLTLMAASLEMKTSKADRPFLAMSMGHKGIITRITGEIFGSSITFASLHKNSAPGQLSLEDTRNIINKLKY